MARPRNNIPRFFSFDSLELLSIRAELGKSWHEWLDKALDDLVSGCVAKDVDERVIEMFNTAKERMLKTQDDNRKKYEARKKPASSTEVVPVNGSKRNDQLIWGRFENVYLSQDEWNTLLQDFGNLNFLKDTIEAFSASLADGHTTSNNHFATLTRWIAARKRWKEEEENKTHYESVSEHNARVLENGRKWIDEHFGDGK